MSDFTRERLKRLLATQRPVFWRHDVDFDPDCALKMARLEHRLGVQSTYYVMARSEFYNPFAAKTRQTFLEIAGYGHKLGLHVDLELGRRAEVDVRRMVDYTVDDRALLCRVLPVEDCVSFHAPPSDVYWRDVPGFEHALAPMWRGRYVADSRGRFAHGEPEHYLALDGPVQIGLHCEWWWWPPERAERSRKIEAGKP